MLEARTLSFPGASIFSRWKVVVLTDHPKMVAETSLHLAKAPCQPCYLSMFQNGERYNSNNAHFGEAVKHQLDMESLFYQPLAVVFREFFKLSIKVRAL